MGRSLNLTQKQSQTNGKIKKDQRQNVSPDSLHSRHLRLFCGRQ